MPAATPPGPPREQGSAHHQAGETVRGGWAEGGSFFGSVMGGFLLGFGADWIFSTDPLFTVIGIVVGSIGGFYRMMAWAKVQEERDRRERYGR